tara:strand:- start:1176 stop:1685 length:510 start_codon:yes stop_codon:yes gene_type:complete
METSDSFKVIVIILIFTLLELVSLIMMYFNRDIFKNTCNPILIPFSKLYSDEDPNEILIRCMREFSIEYMDIYIKPFKIMINYFSNMGFTFINIINQLHRSLDDITGNQLKLSKLFENGLQDTLSVITDNLRSVFDEMVDAESYINSFTEIIENRFDKVEDVIISKDNE